MGTQLELSLIEIVVSRYDILLQIEQGAREKRNLVENVESSRTTVDRSIRELEDANILRRQNGICEFTRYGKIVYDRLSEVVETCERLRAAPELLSTLPSDVPIGSTIADATEVETTPERAPAVPFKNLDPPPNSDVVRVGLSMLFSQQLDLILEQLDRGASLELVVHSDLVDPIERNFPEILSHLAANSSPIHVMDEFPPFGLTIFDSAEVRVSVHQEGSGLRGVIRNDRPEAVDKSISIFERYKRESHVIRPSERP